MPSFRSSSLNTSPPPLPSLSLSALLNIDGIAMVTNMHLDMGSQSQDGFLGEDNEGNKIKVQEISWIRGVQATVRAARKYKFEVAGRSRIAFLVRRWWRVDLWVGGGFGMGLFLRKVG